MHGPICIFWANLTLFSLKANVPCPRRMAQYEAFTEFVHCPDVQPGDAVIFCEATTHGTLPWAAPHERRAVLTRYCPPAMAYMPPGGGGQGGGYTWPAQTRAFCHIPSPILFYMENPYKRHT